jgi:hypothetical protein
MSYHGRSSSSHSAKVSTSLIKHELGEGDLIVSSKDCTQNSSVVCSRGSTTLRVLHSTLKVAVLSKWRRPVIQVANPATVRVHAGGVGTRCFSHFRG